MNGVEFRSVRKRKTATRDDQSGRNENNNKVRDATEQPLVRPCLVTSLVVLCVAAVASLTVYLFLAPADLGFTDIILPIGRVRGKVLKAPNGRLVHRFLGIPYAEPPVGALRFSNPVPLTRLPQDPYYATDYKYSCPHFPDLTYGDFVGSAMWNAPNPIREDCLFLNVWLPAACPEGTKRDLKLPVLVWIYGGGFYSGSSALDVYEDTVLASHGDVIVVTFNYRIGALGFLSTGDGRIKGNFGLLDQVLALHWVQQNIKAFGGDPGHVTLFGESAGAASIGLHLLSPLTEGLFLRAVLQSGGPTALWAYMDPGVAQKSSDIFLHLVGCTQTSEKDLLTCLQSLNLETIMNNEWVDLNYMAFPWVPSIDGNYITDSPIQLLKSRLPRPIDAILGVNANEGTFYNLYSLPGLNKDDPNCFHNFTMFREAERILNWDLTANQSQNVAQFYVENQIINTSDPVANRNALDKVSGDRLLTCPTWNFAHALLEAGSRQYFYHLGHRASIEVWPEWMGVIHGAEIQWLFGVPLRVRGYTPEEQSLSRTVMSYLANFARTGNPNEEGLHFWPQNSLSETNILDISAPQSFQVQHTLRERFCEFWKQLT